MLLRLFVPCVLPVLLSAQSGGDLGQFQQKLAQCRAAADPTCEATALLDIANYYYDLQEDSLALAYATAGLKRAPADRLELKGQLFYRKAMLLFNQPAPPEQYMPLLDSAYVLLKSADAPGPFITLLQSFGAIKNHNLQAQQGLELLKEAEHLYFQNKTIVGTDRMLNLYSNMMAASLSLGDYGAALEYARKGIDLGKNTTYYEYLADLHYNNAIIHQTLGNLRDAEVHYLKSLELNRKGNISAGVIAASTALGSFYSSQNQPALGLRYFKEARSAAVAAQDHANIALSDRLLAAYYLEQKDYSTALESIDASIENVKQHSEPRLLQGIFIEKARILQAAGQLDSAAVWAGYELELAQRTNSISQQSAAYLLFSEIEKSKGRFEQALAFHELYVTFKDSVYNSSLEEKVALERTRQNIEAEQEARQKAELEAELLASRNLLYGAIAAALGMLLLMGGYLYWQLRKSRQLLETQNLQLAQLNQTKDKFFGIIAHDLRNPLTAFQGVGEQLRFYLEKGDAHKLLKISDLISKSVANLSSLLDNLLAWALLNRGMIPCHPEPLSPAVEAAANFQVHENAAAAKNIRINSDIPAQIRVQADRNALQTILRNLIGNAIKFTPAGGNVALDCETKGDRVFIRVSDSGTGIASDKIPHLFSLGKRSTPGTAGEKGAGLGLLLSKELVEMHGGVLEVESTIGKGTTFGFSLPI